MKLIIFTMACFLVCAYIGNFAGAFLFMFLITGASYLYLKEVDKRKKSAKIES